MLPTDMLSELEKKYGTTAQKDMIGKAREERTHTFSTLPASVDAPVRNSSYMRAQAYFILARALYSGTISLQSQSITASIKSLAQAFEKSEFLIGRAFSDSTKSHTNTVTVSEDIHAGSSPANVATDVPDLLKLDYASTNENNSVYGPAAYFYDLIRIVLTCIQVGDPRNSEITDTKYTLLARRPDLLDIPLDSLNSTEWVMPTLSIINYVLARQLLQNQDWVFLTAERNQRKPDYARLMTDYDTAVFGLLANKGKYKFKGQDLTLEAALLPNDVFHFPFDLNFEAENTYLMAMGKNIYDILQEISKLKSSPSDSETEKLAYAYLRLSPSAVEQLEHPVSCKLLDTAHSSPYSVDTLEFSKRTHIDYARLGSLLHISDCKTVARTFVNTMINEHTYQLYINNDGTQEVIQFKLMPELKRESLQFVTDERIKRMGVFNYLAEQTGFDCDELELVFSALNFNPQLPPNPGAPSRAPSALLPHTLTFSDANIKALSLFKKLKDHLSIPVIELVKLFVRPDNKILFSVVLEHIRPQTGANKVWQIHWVLLPAYLRLLDKKSSITVENPENHTFENPILDDALANAKILLKQCESYDDYANVSNQLSGDDKAKAQAYFIYYANQIIAYLSVISGLTVEELKLIYEKDTLDINASSSIVENYIKNIYSYGLLKRFYKRSLIELCQLASYLTVDQDTSALSFEAVNSTGLQKLRSIVSPVDSQESLKSLINLDELNQRALSLSWNLDDLMLVRFGARSAAHEQKVSVIQQSLLQPFFRELAQKVLEASSTSGENSTSAQTLGIQWLTTQLNNIKFTASLESNFSALFGLDPTDFHRLMLGLEDRGASFYYDILNVCDLTKITNSPQEPASTTSAPSANTQSLQAIYFGQRLAMIVNFLNMKNTPANQERWNQQVAIIEELDAAIQELSEKVPPSPSPLPPEQPAPLWLEKISDFKSRYAAVLPLHSRRSLIRAHDNLRNMLRQQRLIITPGTPKDAAGILDLTRFNQALLEFYTIAIFIDDIDILVNTLNYKSAEGTSPRLSVNLDRSLIKKIVDYTQAKTDLDDNNSDLFINMFSPQTHRNTLVIAALKVGLPTWDELNNALALNTQPTTMISGIDQYTMLARLKNCLKRFDSDAKLVIAFLQGQDATFIAEHLGKVLQYKDREAYDRAVRKLGERKRDVLVATVLKYFNRDAKYAPFKLNHADKLSEYLLLDVSMSGSDSISPIVQAHGTLQWYLRRCVEGVEQDSYDLALTSNIADSWWSWIQNYRVWEANRQVFLYPENFLDPALRITRSGEFDKFSKIVRKPSLDDDTISGEYIRYITDTMNLRGLQVRGVCAEPVRSTLPNIRTLHIFGADNRPSEKKYYHCTVQQLLNYQSSKFFEFFVLTPPFDPKKSASKEAIAKRNTPDLYIIQKEGTRNGKVVLYILKPTNSPDISENTTQSEVEALGTVTAFSDKELEVLRNFTKEQWRTVVNKLKKSKAGKPDETASQPNLNLFKRFSRLSEKELQTKHLSLNDAERTFLSQLWKHYRQDELKAKPIVTSDYYCARYIILPLNCDDITATHSQFLLNQLDKSIWVIKRTAPDSESEDNVTFSVYGEESDYQIPRQDGNATDHDNAASKSDRKTVVVLDYKKCQDETQFLLHTAPNKPAKAGYFSRLFACFKPNSNEVDPGVTNTLYAIRKSDADGAEKNVVITRIVSPENNSALAQAEEFRTDYPACGKETTFGFNMQTVVDHSESPVILAYEKSSSGSEYSEVNVYSLVAIDKTYSYKLYRLSLREHKGESPPDSRTIALKTYEENNNVVGISYKVIAADKKVIKETLKFNDFPEAREAVQDGKLNVKLLEPHLEKIMRIARSKQHLSFPQAIPRFRFFARNLQDNYFSLSNGNIVSVGKNSDLDNTEMTVWQQLREETNLAAEADKNILSHNTIILSDILSMIATDANQLYTLLVAYDNADLYVIHRDQTASGKVEIYILMQGDGYTKFGNHYITSMPVCGPECDFLLLKNNDLVIIQKFGFKKSVIKETGLKITVLSAEESYANVSKTHTVGSAHDTESFGSETQFAVSLTNDDIFAFRQFEEDKFHKYIIHNVDNGSAFVIRLPAVMIYTHRKIEANDKIMSTTVAGHYIFMSAPTRERNALYSIVSSDSQERPNLHEISGSQGLDIEVFHIPKGSISKRELTSGNMFLWIQKSANLETRDALPLLPYQVKVNVYINRPYTTLSDTATTSTNGQFGTSVSALRIAPEPNFSEEDFKTGFITPLREINSRIDGSQCFQNWTFWEKVVLPIPTDTETPFQAIFVYGRVYIYWLQTQTSEDLDLGDTSKPKELTSINLSSQKKTRYQIMYSYQHLDGSWETTQIIDRKNNANDCQGFFPSIETAQLLVNPLMTLTRIDIFGRYHNMGEVDPAPYGLALLAGTDLSPPTAFNNFLQHLYQAVATTTNFTVSTLPMFTVDQSALRDMPSDDLWGQYYWEIMHFAPLTLANALQAAGKFSMALTWYKGLFNPSLRSQSYPMLARENNSPFVFGPFTRALGNNIFTPLLNQRTLKDMHEHAFESHRMASMRGPLPYKKHLLMAYVRNLIAWGDSLFVADRESINDAVTRYFAAHDLLGDTPKALYSARYDETRQNNTLDELFIHEVSLVVSGRSYPSGGPIIIYPYNLNRSSYFHVPENREFMALWSQVADRLYKIRHSLSIAGIGQQLALLSPPIDPHQLVAAVAARGGGFVREILATINQDNRPPYRFLVSLQKAKEFAGYVENLGNQLLSALERQDNAALVAINNEYAQYVLETISGIKQANKTHIEHECTQVGLTLNEDDTVQSMLPGSLADNINTRIKYYENLSANNGVSTEELAADVVRGVAFATNMSSQYLTAAACVAGGTPDIGSPFALKWGGKQLKNLLKSPVYVLNAISTAGEYTAGQLERSSHYKRRKKDWDLQLELARKELAQLVTRQKMVNIQKAVATAELDNHDKAIRHQRKVNCYYQSQFTNVDLYTWFVNQLMELYQTTYDLALRVANQAKAAYEFELGVSVRMTKLGLWSNSRKGLLAGSGLMQQLHEMEQSYLENHKRVPEIEKVFSLRELCVIDEADKQSSATAANLETTITVTDSDANDDPEANSNKVWLKAIQSLKDTGIIFTLRAEFFNNDFTITDTQVRKIKMIQITTPALGSPNQQVSLKLSHKGQVVYISKSVAGTGMFNPSLEDARYLPFEGLDADNSIWTLVVGNSSPTTKRAGIFQPNPLDIYDSLSDIQIRVLYTIIPKLTPSLNYG